MPRTLRAADHRAHPLSPTTTTKFAGRILAAARAVAEFDLILADAVPYNIMLRLLEAEDLDHSAALDTLALPGSVSRGVQDRYVAMLVKRGWVEQRTGLLGLTPAGYDVIVGALEAVYAAQRALD